MKAKRKKPRFKTVHFTAHTVECNGEAHSNAYIDHCMVCLNYGWGELPGEACTGEGCAECAKGNKTREFSRKVFLEVAQ